MTTQPGEGIAPAATETLHEFLEAADTLKHLNHDAVMVWERGDWKSGDTAQKTLNIEAQLLVLQAASHVYKLATDQDGPVSMELIEHAEVFSYRRFADHKLGSYVASRFYIVTRDEEETGVEITGTRLVEGDLRVVQTMTVVSAGDDCLGYRQWRIPANDDLIRRLLDLEDLSVTQIGVAAMTGNPEAMAKFGAHVLAQPPGERDGVLLADIEQRFAEVSCEYGPILPGTFVRAQVDRAVGIIDGFQPIPLS